MNDSERREGLETTLADVRREFTTLSKPGLTGIIIAIWVAGGFSVLLIFAVLKLLTGDASAMAGGRGSGFGQIFALLFFMMPIIFSAKLAVTRISIRRRRNILMKAEKELLTALEKQD